MENLLKYWGMVIRTKRIELGYTQEHLAGISTISNVYISKLERGLVNPSCKLLEKLCQALSMEVKCLLCENFTCEKYKEYKKLESKKIR